MHLKQNRIDTGTLLKATGLSHDFEPFDGVGDLYANHAPRILSYIMRPDLLAQLECNPHIAGVFCTPALEALVPKHVIALCCDDPTWYYFSLVNYLAAHLILPDTHIDASSHTQGSWIAPRGVHIAAHCHIDPFVSIYEATTLGEGVQVRSGAALGLDSFQHQRTSKGIISPRHDGQLRIGNRVEIGANAAISRGFSYRDTVIEADVKIDAQVSIAHGVTIGERSIICAGALILGHSTLGEDVFVGPGAVIRNRVHIGNRARISIGSVVTQDVPEGETVTGNFAVRHEDWLAFVKKLAAAK